METFTIREAAERCKISHQLVRKRVDRGTLQTVKRDGVRRIPRSELERTGLWPGPQLQPQLSDSLEVTTLQAELAETQTQLATERRAREAERQARQLAEVSLHEQRAVAMTAEAQRAEALTREAEAERERQAAAERLETLTDGGLITGVRALLALRRENGVAPEGQPVPA